MIAAGAEQNDPRRFYLAGATRRGTSRAARTCPCDTPARVVPRKRTKGSCGATLLACFVALSALGPRLKPVNAGQMANDAQLPLEPAPGAREAESAVTLTTYGLSPSRSGRALMTIT